MLRYYGDDMEEYRTCEDNIKMDFKEIAVDVINLLKIEIVECSYYIGHYRK